MSLDVRTLILPLCRMCEEMEMAAAKEKTSTEKGSSRSTKEIEKKWSKPLIDAGWTAIPNVLFERQAAIGLQPLDINIILHLAGYWWKAGNRPYPSKETLAVSIGVTPRTIQRHIAALEGAGFITRIARKSVKGRSLSNEYSLSGLIKAAKPFAEERVVEKKQRKAAALERAKRKRPETTALKK